MEKEVLLKDVMPYIQIWTGIIIMALLIMTYRLRRFAKRYPEIFQPDTTADDNLSLSRKAELRRRYNNQSMCAISVIFVWMIGMALTILGFISINQGWIMIIYAVIMLLFVVSMIQRKPKK